MRIVDQRVVHENTAVANTSEVYSGTSIAIHEDGGEVLVCAFRLGSAKVSADGRILLRESRDGGKTWATVACPMDAEGAKGIAPLGGARQLAGPHLGSSTTGTSILAGALMTLVEPGSPKYQVQTAGIIDATCAFSRRETTGWSQPLVVDGRRTNAEWSIPCGTPTDLGGGRWIVPAERHAKPDDPQWLRRYNAFSFVSVDDGDSWADQGEMLNDPDQVCVYYDQHLVALPGGRLLSLAWTHNALQDRTVTARAGMSLDGGATWSTPWDTGIQGGPIAPVRLPDGRLFAVYPRREEPVGIRACVSLDDGATWELDDEFVIWDERLRAIAGVRAVESPVGGQQPLWDTMWGWTFGLPTPALHDDASVAVVFYASGLDGRSRVHYVRIEP